MENNILKENKKTIKEIIIHLFLTVIGIVCYGYVFSVALGLLNKSDTFQNYLGGVILFILCGIAILYGYLRYKEYNKNTENKSKENNTEEK